MYDYKNYMFYFFFLENLANTIHLCKVKFKREQFSMDPVQNLQNRLTDQTISCTAPVLCQPKLMFGPAKLRSSLETVQTELSEHLHQSIFRMSTHISLP